MTCVALVVARAANGVIGFEGTIPWRLPEDLRRFRKITMGKPCIMGRKTWESLPNKPLPGRLNILVTRDRGFVAAGAIIEHSLARALVRGRSEGAAEIAVIGGAGIYREALPQADAIYLTEVHAEFAGDVFFPELEPDEWEETERDEHVSADSLRYAFVTLRRIRRSEKRKDGEG